MLHWEMPVKLSFKTSGKVLAWKVHPVATDLENLLMGNLFAQVPALLQAQVPAQSSKESTMCVHIYTNAYLTIFLCCFINENMNH